MTTFTRGEKIFELSNQLGNSLFRTCGILVTISDRKILVKTGSGSESNGGCDAGTAAEELTLTERGTATSMVAKNRIRLLPGFSSGSGDSFTAYIDNSRPGCELADNPTANPDQYYYIADVISANDYYPGGMQMPGRKYSEGEYRYGFNGKENENEVKGEGNQQDYGMRIYDPRLGRFLSLDPLTKEYPELTPYQFASNTPIWAIDLDGLEGLVATGMPMGNSGHGHGMIVSVQDARKINNTVANWVSGKHQQGMRNVRIAEQAKQQAIKQGRIDGDGITWWTKVMVYIAPWWNSTATFSDANDGAVLMQGKNLDGSDATVGDYAAAGVGIFIPFVSGSSIKNLFKGFSTSVKGYKYGGKTFRNAEEFGKAVTELAGNSREKRALIESVTRGVAETNGWKKSTKLSGTSLGEEVYELGKDTYGSVDKYHGNFEIFKKNGKTYQHQGSIDIDGFKNKERNSKYDVKL